MITVRFAPSPTGFLHLGNARTALLNWLFARQSGGRFILRLDDTDVARSTEEYALGIREDLDWLGLAPDHSFRQSDRLASYDAVVERLKASERLYACYETPEELDRKRKRQMARGMPPVYDRAALTLTAEDRSRYEAEGRLPHWRFLLEDRPVAWHDLIRGPQSVRGDSLSDPVLIRGDGTYLYTFTSVVDDVEEGISHVIRGEDHVTNTAVQIQIFEALGDHVPTFAHHSLLLGADGQGLSKRSGALSIAGLREAGIEAMAIVSLAATLGTSDMVAVHGEMGELIEAFDLEKLSRAPVRFDERELRALNAKLLHSLPFEAVAARLAEMGVSGGPEFWEAVRGNVETLADVRLWWDVVTGPVTAVIEDQDFVDAAVRSLPSEPWTVETWREWTGAVKEATGRKGKALFMPLRQALTGLEHGPELAGLLPLIGRERVLERLHVKR